MKKLGIVGIGTYGFPIALNFLRKGFNVAAFDTRREALESFRKTGGMVADTLQNLAACCEVIFLCLPSSEETEKVMLGSQGLLSCLAEGKWVVDLGNGDPLRTAHIAGCTAQKGIVYIDAPFCGEIQDAQEGTLSVMVGGNCDSLEKIIPFLKAIAKEVYHLGPSGSGHKAKLIHGIIAGVNLAILCEAMVLGIKAGLEPEKILEVINAGAADSYISRRKGAKILKHDFAAGLKVTGQEDIMKIARQLEKQAGLTLPVKNLASQMFVAAKAMGMADADVCAVIKPYEELSRAQVGN